MRLARAVDLWMGELARAGRAQGTRDAYFRYLNKLIDHLERTKPDPMVQEVTVNDCRSFLDRWIDRAPSTQCTVHSALNGLFDWLYLEGEIEGNPMIQIKRPRRLRPEDAPVVTLTRAEVEKMLDATDGWQEFLCLSILAYMGARRDSASRLRWKDVDLDAGTLRFLEEKGGKYAERPMPYDLVAILKAARESGEGRDPRERLRDPDPPQGNRAARRALQQGDLEHGWNRGQESRSDRDRSRLPTSLRGGVS